MYETLNDIKSDIIAFVKDCQSKNYPYRSTKGEELHKMFRPLPMRTMTPFRHIPSFECMKYIMETDYCKHDEYDSRYTSEPWIIYFMECLMKESKLPRKIQYFDFDYITTTRLIEVANIVSDVIDEFRNMDNSLKHQILRLSANAEDTDNVVGDIVYYGVINLGITKYSLLRYSIFNNSIQDEHYVNAVKKFIKCINSLYDVTFEW